MSKHIFDTNSFTDPQKSQKEIFQNFRRPKIIISENIIFITDPPIFFRFVLALFFFLIALLAIVTVGGDRTIGVIGGITLGCACTYNSLCLHRVRIDLNKKIVYFTSLNPIENLLNKFLKRSTAIPFSKVEKIYCDYPLMIGHGEKSYDLYLKSRDGYKLKIGIFKKEAEATSFEAFLKSKIR